VSKETYSSADERAATSVSLSKITQLNSLTFTDFINLKIGDFCLITTSPNKHTREEVKDSEDTHTHTHTSFTLSWFVCVHARTHSRIRSRMHAHTRTRTRSSTHTHTHTHAHTAQQDEVKDLQLKLSKLHRENEELKGELNCFDPAFFDEIEDLKYNHNEMVRTQKKKGGGGGAGGLTVGKGLGDQ